MVKMSTSVNVSGMAKAHGLLMLLMSEPCDDFIFILQLFPEKRHLLHQFLHLTKIKSYTKDIKLFLHINKYTEGKKDLLTSIFRPKEKANSP